MPKTIEESVRDFTKRLQQLKNVEGKSAITVDEGLQWAAEMQQALDSQRAKPR